MYVCVCIYIYRMAQEKPARRLVSILRTDTPELHRVYDNMLQRAQKCIDVQGDHFQHLL